MANKQFKPKPKKDSRDEFDKAKQPFKYGKGNKSRGKVIKEQPKKDSKAARVNLDNVRVSDLSKLFTRADSNHVEWDLKKDPTSVKLAASIPFSSVPGRDNGMLNTIPGVMTLTWMPTFGSPHTQTLSALKESLYSYVVHANSRTKLYDPNDLLLMVLAVQEIFTKIAELKRVYGVMRSWHGSNDYTPRLIVQALGFDYKDLVNNYPTMVSDLNLLIAETKQLWVPNTFPVLDRYLWMASNIFQDSDNPKGQYVMYVRGMYLKYDETTYKTGGALIPANYDFSENTESEYSVWDFNCNAMDAADFKASALTTGTLTWEQHLQMLRNMIVAIRNSSDRGMICGDILNAYGIDKILTALPLDPNYEVIPGYNPEVMWQIENLITYPNYPTHLYQNMDNNTIFVRYHDMKATVATTKPAIYTTTYDPPTSATTTYQQRFKNALLNFHQQTQPTPEQVIVATRNTAVGIQWDRFVAERLTDFVAIYGPKPVAAGTTIVTGVRMYTAVKRRISNTGVINYYAPDEKNFMLAAFAGNAAGFIYYINGTLDPVSSSEVTSPRFMELWESFDWAPHVYNDYVSGAYLPTYRELINERGRDLNGVSVYAEYDLYQVVGIDELARIHDFCSYSEFDIPVM